MKGYKTLYGAFVNNVVLSEKVDAWAEDSIFKKAILNKVAHLAFNCPWDIDTPQTIEVFQEVNVANLVVIATHDIHNSPQSNNLFYGERLNADDEKLLKKGFRIYRCQEVIIPVVRVISFGIEKLPKLMPLNEAFKTFAPPATPKKNGDEIELTVSAVSSGKRKIANEDAEPTFATSISSISNAPSALSPLEEEVDLQVSRLPPQPEVFCEPDHLAPHPNPPIFSADVAGPKTSPPPKAAAIASPDEPSTQSPPD